MRGYRRDGTIAAGSTPTIIPRFDRDPDPHMWPTTGWFGLVPPSVAIRQYRWERGQVVLRVRQAGATYREIGEYLGVSVERARQRVFEAQRKARLQPPVMRWATDASALFWIRQWLPTLARGRLQRGNGPALHTEAGPPTP